MVQSPVHNSVWVKRAWLPFRPCSLSWCLWPPGFWWVSTSTWCLLLWGPRYVMVSYCHSWPVDEAISELSDAGAPFTSAFMMALVNRVSSGFLCGTLPSGGAFDLTLSSHSSMPTSLCFFIPFSALCQDSWGVSLCSVVAITFSRPSKANLVETSHSLWSLPVG